jgi:extracellular factor (EF) 3-hydroxypalmitic acid methyl ester biosynthesis protein
MRAKHFERFRAAFGESMCADTLQGFALAKPHGNPGDFEIIDRIYQNDVSSDPRFRSWDRMFHWLTASVAVRNRKEYFINWLTGKPYSHQERPLKVLNVASGPARDVYEFFCRNPSANVLFTCVDQDARAIEYASALCHEYRDRIMFKCANALRFRPSGSYDLIWSGGLCDYFSDRVFSLLLKRLYSALADRGELVFGNFADRNPARGCMEVACDWLLLHRDEESLRRIAIEAGIEADLIRVESEPANVNLFLHVRKRTL